MDPSFPAPPPGSSPEPSAWERRGEWAVILVSVASLWPYVLGWPHWFWQVLGCASVACLLALLALKLVRLRKVEPPEIPLAPGGARRPRGTPAGRKLSKGKDGG